MTDSPLAHDAEPDTIRSLPPADVGIEGGNAVAPKESGTYVIGVFADPESVDILPTFDDGSSCLHWMEHRRVIVQATLQIDRVLYLYHYFIPLLLSLFLFPLVLEEVRSIGRRAYTEEGKLMTLLAIGLLVFVSYQFYRPLTYYEPVTDAQFQRRALLNIWELRCVHCAQDSPFVLPGESTP